MIHLHLARHSRDLIVPLLDSFKGHSILQTKSVVVPGEQLQKWLKFQIVEQQGVLFGWEFTGFESMLSQKAQEQGLGIWPKPLDIQLCLFSLFEQDSFMGKAQLKEVKSWLDSASNEKELTLRKFQLSSRLLTLFSTYEDRNSKILKSWLKGELHNQLPEQQAYEIWQKEFWIELYGPNGYFKKHGYLSFSHFAQPEIASQLVFEGDIHLFGFDRLYGCSLEVIKALSNNIDIHLYCLDVKTPEATQERQQALNYLNAQLANQSNISKNEAVTVEVKNMSSIKEECDHVADEVWDYVLKNQCRFDEIAVILPANQFDTYSLQIKSSFDENHKIPVSMMEESKEFTPRLFEAFELLLDLVNSQFTRKGLLQLLLHPNFSHWRMPGDRQLWVRWCDKLAVFRGRDKDQGDSRYIKKDLRNWQQALRRLALSTHCVTSVETFSSGSNSYKTMELNQEEMASSARFISMIRSLMSDCDYLRASMVSLSEWSRRLMALFDFYFVSGLVDNSREQNVISDVLIKLGEAEQFNKNSLSFDSFLLFLKESLSQQTKSISFRQQGVWVSSHLSQRFIPFKMLFWLGLSDKNFPSKEKQVQLDMAMTDEMSELVKRANLEKLSFYESQLLVEERFVLSYVDRDSESGEPLQPSLFVKEIAEKLKPQKQYVSSHNLINKEQQLAVSLRNNRTRPYFIEDIKQSHNSLLKEWCGFYEPVKEMTTEVRQESSLSLKMLSDFLICPMQAWSRHVLGFSDRRPNDIYQEDECFQTEFINKSTMLKELFAEAKGVNSTELLEEKVVEWEIEGNVSTGFFLEGEKQSWSSILNNWEVALAHAEIEAPYHFAQFGGGRELSMTDIQLDALSIGDWLIEGKTGLIASSKDAMVVPVSGSGSSNMSKYYIRGFVEMVALLISGHCRPKSFSVIVVDRKNAMARSRLDFNTPSVTEAKKWFELLLQELLFERHNYLLPIEAVFEHLKKGIDLELSLEKYLSNTFSKCSSHYGPISNITHISHADSENFEKRYVNRYELFFKSLK